MGVPPTDESSPGEAVGDSEAADGRTTPLSGTRKRWGPLMAHSYVEPPEASPVVAPAKKFDCLKWTREVRDEINAEIADMSVEERLWWWAAQRPTDPFLARLWDRGNPPKRSRRAASDAPPAAIAGP